MSNKSPFSDLASDNHLKLKQIEDRRLKELLNCLRYWEIALNDESVLLVSTLTPHEFKCLENLVRQLVLSKLLTANTFVEALRRSSAKEEKILLSPVVMTRDEEDTSSRSNLCVDGTLSIFTEHKTKKHYFCGSYGKVEQAYSSSDSMTAIYAIKKYVPNEIIPSESQAKRELKYHRMLGRNAFFFTNNEKSTLITDWLPGKALSLFSNDELLAIPVIGRVRALGIALNELDCLHQKLRVHGDIKDANFILEPMAQSLRITDFGSCRKIYSKKSIFMSTWEFWDPDTRSTHDYTLCDDMYALGFIVAKLFPEICLVEVPDYQDARVNIGQGPTDDLIWSAITVLVESMTNRNAVYRCTCSDAYDYCIKVLDTIDTMTLEQLNLLQEGTICRKSICEEDAYRGATKGFVNYPQSQ